MTDTNKLSSVALADVSGSDLLRLWSQRFGGDMAVSLTILQEWIASQSSASDLVTQYAAPTATGFTVTVAAADTWLVLTPAADYAAGTIVLPSGADKAEILVNCTTAVTALTLTPQSGDSVVGGPTALAANGYFRLRYDAVLDRWYRVG